MVINNLVEKERKKNPIVYPRIDLKRLRPTRVQVHYKELLLNQELNKSQSPLNSAKVHEPHAARVHVFALRLLNNQSKVLITSSFFFFEDKVLITSSTNKQVNEKVLSVMEKKEPQDKLFLGLQIF